MGTGELFAGGRLLMTLPGVHAMGDFMRLQPQMLGTLLIACLWFRGDG